MEKYFIKNGEIFDSNDVKYNYAHFTDLLNFLENASELIGMNKTKSDRLKFIYNVHNGMTYEITNCIIINGLAHYKSMPIIKQTKIEKLLSIFK